MSLLETLLGDRDEDDPDCRCEPTVRDGRLRLDAGSCPGDGDLASHPVCRATVVDAVVGEEVESILTANGGLQRRYRDRAVALLGTAGRFADAAAFHDDRVARLARRDPVAAGHEAAGRADAIGDIGERSGLVAAAERAPDSGLVFRSFAGPTVSRWRVDPAVPGEARLERTTDLETGGTARVYRPPDGVRYYHLDPLEAGLSSAALATLERAHAHLAAGHVDGGTTAPGRAVRAVADETDPVEPIARVLRKHVQGHGLLEDFFADPAVSDVFVTAPAADNPVRVTVDGDGAITNVRLTDRGVAALASRFRRESGRAFSRAAPRLDATARVADRRVRVAGVTEPTSRGDAFAFRAHDRRAWTLPALVANGTLSAMAAGLLSVAVIRGAALLFAGPRGAGKTTLLAATLWELPPGVRTVVIEDAPELPLDQLQDAGRDVQGLTAAQGETAIGPAEALRTALRLGDGALVVGEVRGSEAGVLYEAMRVGASSEAVLGTIHGTDASAVRDRVVNDLGVPPASFGATDAIVSLAFEESEDGSSRRVRGIEEVVAGGDTFADLLSWTGEGLEATGRLQRGNSELLAGLAGPGETYADVLGAVARRREKIAGLARAGRTEPSHRTEAGGRAAPGDRPARSDQPSTNDQSTSSDQTATCDLTAASDWSARQAATGAGDGDVG